MNQIDEIAHLIQLSIAPVFLLTGVGTLLNVLSGRLARIIDRARAIAPIQLDGHSIASFGVDDNGSVRDRVDEVLCGRI